MVTHLAACLLALLALTSHVLAWETEQEAARQVRQLLNTPDQHFGVGVLSTLYARDAREEQNVPLQGHEYFAPCYDNGDLSFIALPVSQNWRNALSKGANVSFAISSHPDTRVPDPRHEVNGEWDPERPDWRKGQPSKLRFTLFGSMVLQNAHNTSQNELTQISRCFLHHHPDSSKWAPGSKDSPHFASWAKFCVSKIYAVGGFGDEHRIGWISHDAYNKAASALSYLAEPLASDDRSLEDVLDAPELFFGDSVDVERPLQAGEYVV